MNKAGFLQKAVMVVSLAGTAIGGTAVVISSRERADNAVTESNLTRGDVRAARDEAHVYTDTQVLSAAAHMKEYTDLQMEFVKEQNRVIQTQLKEISVRLEELNLRIQAQDPRP